MEHPKGDSAPRKRGSSVSVGKPSARHQRCSCASLLDRVQSGAQQVSVALCFSSAPAAWRLFGCRPPNLLESSKTSQTPGMYSASAEPPLQHGCSAAGVTSALNSIKATKLQTQNMSAKQVDRLID